MLNDKMFVFQMTESYLRKHKVQNILSLLLTKHIGCLIRSHEMLSAQRGEFVVAM